MAIDPEFARILNAILMGALVLLGVGFTVAFSSRSSAASQADEFSRRVRLPYGSAAIRRSVVRRVRVSRLTTAITMLATALLLTPVLLTPLSTSPVLMIVVLVPILAAIGVASAIINVRERLFHPAPDAPRIARARAMRTSDYLDPLRRLLPWALATASAIALLALVVAWVRHPAGVDGAFARAAVFAAVVSVAVFIALPLVERSMLAQPQPASDTLELAWDDAFRATALGSLRLAAAMCAWLAASLAIGALWLGSDALFSSFAQQVPTWGVIAMTFVYPGSGRRLRAGLYPDWLRGPAPVGAEGSPA